jgi:hypothetical protein
MDEPTSAGAVIELILNGLFPDIPVFRDTDLNDYLGVFPNFRIHEGISRVRMEASGTRRPRMQEELQIDFWQQCSDVTTEDVSVVPAIEQALDDFVSTRIGPNGTLIRLVSEGPGRHDFNAQTLIVQDLLTVTATMQPASAQLQGTN